MLTPGRRSAAGDPDIAARLAQGRLEDVPVEALQAGLRLPLHDYLGLELTGLRPVVVEAALTEHTRSLTAPLHGGVVATLVDVAGGIATAVSGAVDITRYGLVTGRLEIDYRAQPRGERVRAEAEIVRAEHRTAHATCTVTDDGGRTVAAAVAEVRLLPGGGTASTSLHVDGTGG